jgi:hypothetical protein
MTDQTKIVKGGFRSTLALIIALIAIILAYMAYSSSTKDNGMNAQINRLQATMEKMKAESGDQLDKLREETAQTLDKMGQALKMNKPNDGDNNRTTGK